MQIKILTGADEYLINLEKDILNAKKRVYIQTMSFEGDAIGKKIFSLLKASKAKDKRICIDSYSKVVINDRFIHSPFSLFNKALRKEVKETRKIIKNFPEIGVAVKYTNPLGFLFFNYPKRNHKKMVVIDDDISYTGGYNLCEHNFAWRDMSIRINSKKINTYLQEDFLSTWQNINKTIVKNEEQITLITSSGRQSKEAFDVLFAEFRKAKHKITIFSPYITNPFLKEIMKIRPKGVTVQIVSPLANNKPLLGNYLIHKRKKMDFELHLYSGNMSHLKAVLIDDTALIAGTSNFDFVSYYLEQEIFTIIRDKKTINKFRKEILDEDLNSSELQTETKNKFAVIIFKIFIDCAIGFCRLHSKIFK